MTEEEIWYLPSFLLQMCLLLQSITLSMSFFYNLGMLAPFLSKNYNMQMNCRMSQREGGSR